MAHTLGENGGDGQLGLIDEDEAAPLFAGPVRHVADTLAQAKGRGRPKGSRNKRSKDMVEYMKAMGYRDPMETLAAIASADPKELATELSGLKFDDDGKSKLHVVTAGEAMGLIVKAAGELMPYFHSKAPTEVHVEEKRLGLLLVGNLDEAAVASGEFMSLTGVVGEGEQDQ